jgi:hypothetical protein
MDKQKGMLQMLWERGVLNKTKQQQYTIVGKKDTYGVLILSTRLKFMVLNLLDFKEE